MREDLLETSSAEKISTAVNKPQDLGNYILRFPTKMYTRSSILQDSKQFAPEKLSQLEQWNTNKNRFHKLLADRDMEHSA